MSGTNTPPAETVASQAGAVVPPNADPDIEARARRMGWLPRDSYRGKPELWQEPGDFVERAETMLPIAVAQNRKLESQVDKLTAQMEEAKTLMVGMIDRTRRAEQVGYKRARREIEQDRTRAVAAGDTEAFAAAEERLRDLGPDPDAASPGATRAAVAPPAAPVAATPPAAQAQLDPVVEAWIGQNPWFRANPEANAVAVALHGVVSNQMPHLSLSEKLVETTRRMRQRMPELFGAAETAAPGNPRRAAAAAVSASASAATRAAGPRSYDAMPTEAKREFDRQTKMLAGKGEPLSKDEFAQYYWEQFEEVG